MGDPTLSCFSTSLQQSPSLELFGWGQMWMLLILDFSYLLLHSICLLTQECS